MNSNALQQQQKENIKLFLLLYIFVMNEMERNSNRSKKL